MTANTAFSNEFKSVADLLADHSFAPFALELETMHQQNGRIPNTTSYLLAQQNHLAEKMERLQKTAPQTSLRNVVTQLLNDVPDSVSPEMLLLLTRFIISNWENTTAASALKMAVR